MKNQINLSIETPCSEDFNQFSKTSKGGFCGSCQKEVIDFTTMQAQEIITFFKNKKTENTCGRFKRNQLKAYSQQPEKSKLHSIAYGIGLACLTLFSISTAQAQETKLEPKNKTTQAQQNMLIKGTILDENGSPLPYVNIILEGTTTGTATDFNGNFEFPQKLKKGDVLVISYIGYDTKKITIINENSISNTSLQIDMSMDDVILVGKVATNKEVYTSKRK